MKAAIPILVCGLAAESDVLMKRLSAAGLYVRPELARVGETTALAFWPPQHLHRMPLWDYPEPLIELLESNENRKSALARKLPVEFDKQIIRSFRQGAVTTTAVGQTTTRVKSAASNDRSGASGAATPTDVSQSTSPVQGYLRKARSGAKRIRALYFRARRKALGKATWLHRLVDVARRTVLFRRLHDQPVVWQSAFDVYLMAALIEAFPEIRLVYVQPSDTKAASKSLAEDFADRLAFLTDATLQPDGLVRFGDGQPLRQMHVFNLDGTGYTGPKPRFTLRCSTPLGAQQLLDTYDHVAKHFMEQLGPSRALMLTSDDVVHAPDEAVARVAALAQKANSQPR